jgi:hypothetical protein
MWRWCVWLTLALGLACGAEPTPTETPAPAPEPEARPVPEREAKGKGKRKVPAAPDAQPRVPATGVPDPLAGMGDRELCAGSPAQLMLKYDLGALQSGKCHDVCCPLDSSHWCCELDFPFSDVPPCDAWAEMRNEIFARHGYPFQEQRWRDEFEGEPWYRRREDFDPKWLSKVAADNVATLQEKEQEQIGCMNP